MSTILRVSLLFKNPSTVELINLSNVIWVSKNSLVKQEFNVKSSVHPQIWLTTDERVNNLRLLRELEKVLRSPKV